MAKRHWKRRPKQWGIYSLSQRFSANLVHEQSLKGNWGVFFIAKLGGRLWYVENHKKVICEETVCLDFLIFNSSHKLPFHYLIVRRGSKAAILQTRMMSSHLIINPDPLLRPRHAEILKRCDDEKWWAGDKDLHFPGILTNAIACHFPSMVVSHIKKNINMRRTTKIDKFGIVLGLLLCVLFCLSSILNHLWAAGAGISCR